MLAAYSRKLKQSRCNVMSKAQSACVADRVLWDRPIKDSKIQIFQETPVLATPTLALAATAGITIVAGAFGAGFTIGINNAGK